MTPTPASAPPRRPRFGEGFHSVRAQLMLWNVLTLAAMLALLGGVVQVTVRARLMASVDRDLWFRSQRLVSPPPRPGMPGRPGEPFAGPPPGPGGPPMAGPPLEGLGPYRPVILDAAGNVLLPEDAAGPWDGKAAARAAGGLTLYTNAMADGVPVRVLSRPIPPRFPGPPGASVVQVAYPLTDVNRAVAGLNRTLLMLVPVALFFAGLGGALLTGRMLRPVRRITQTAGRLGAHDLSERLPVLGRDEFAELSETFNGMLARLEAAFGEQGRLVERLREMVERERRFTADASHELRTPLTVIKANASLALSGAEEDPAAARHSLESAREALEEIDRAADTASRLVQDLLLLARSDAGQLARERTPVSVCALLERAASAFPEGEGAPIKVDVPDAALCVPGTADELRRVFSNLLENARRYTPADGRITVSAERAGNAVRITVADTGRGIAPEHLPHLGERFYRADAARARDEKEFGGSGLGLSICRGIVQAHGGAMDIRSAPGTGTAVTVTLPACNPAPDAPGKRPGNA